MVEFHHHHGLCGQRAAEREFVKLRAQPTAKAKAKAMMHSGGSMMHSLAIITIPEGGHTHSK